MTVETTTPAGSAERDQLVAQATQAVKSGQVAQAMQIATAALAKGLVHPLFLNLRAYWLEDNNRPREAQADLREAVRLAPNDAILRNALGLSLARVGRWADAIAEFEAALVQQPKFDAARFNLAEARECFGDLAGAQKGYESVLEVQPGNPQTLSHLAGLASRRADWSLARDYAEKALAVDPKQYLALAALAGAAVASGDFANAETLITSASADAQMPPVNRAMLLTATGDLRDAQGRYGEAFAAYAEGNALRRQAFANVYAAPGRETAASFVEWLSDYLERAPKEAWTVKDKPAVPGPAASHVFLVGFARSGTTLLENILAAHPGIATMEEKEALLDSVNVFLSGETGPDKLAQADDETLAKYRELYWARIGEYCGPVSGKVFIDKRPLGATRLPLIAKLFPQAKVLFALRDPRDVMLSCFRRQFLPNPSMYELLDLKNAAQFYGAVMRLSRICRDKLDLAWAETRHEAVVENFEAEIRKVLAFIGADWRDELTDFAKAARSRNIASASSTQVIRGLNAEGVGHWRHYRAQLGPILPALRPWIEKFGYSGS